MAAWPDGKKVAVGFMVAWEVWPPDLGTSRSHQMKAQAPNPPNALFDRDMWVVYDHMYGEAQGVKRLLRMFAKHDVRATFVANGARIEADPGLASQALDAGHDMSSENYVHEYPIVQTEAEERESLTKTVAAFNTVLGVPPQGYISPGHRPSPNTLPLLFELGYRWSADFQGDDLPFCIERASQVLVGMPYANISDYHTYSFAGRTPQQVQDMLVDEYEGLLEEGEAGEPKMMGYALHPFLCHPYRTRMVERFIDHISPTAWIATRSEIAEWVLDNRDEFPTRAYDDVMADFEP